MPFLPAGSGPVSACPDRGTLIDFDLGKLPEGVCGSVETHLSVCQRCEEVVYALQGETAHDPLVARLRRSRGSPRPRPARGRVMTPR